VDTALPQIVDDSIMMMHRPNGSIRRGIELFSADPLNREMGEKYRQEVLSYGGGKDPWLMVSALLNAPELASGDAEAMREIGRWKLENEGSIPNRY